MYEWCHPQIGRIEAFRAEWLLNLEWVNLMYGSPQAYILWLKERFGR